MSNVQKNMSKKVHKIFTSFYLHFENIFGIIITMLLAIR